jgi:hypothetical protein
MRLFETSPQKLILGSAAASLAAIGIVVLATSMSPSAPAPMADLSCPSKLNVPHVDPAPMPAPPPIRPTPRPLPAPSK